MANCVLVGGWATPLKNLKVNWDDEIPNIWENKTCSKPPTSVFIIAINSGKDYSKGDWGQNMIEWDKHIKR